MPDAHAIFSPSASERWLKCPASIRLSADLPPQEDTVHTERGTLIHAKAEEHLLAWTLPSEDEGDLVGKLTTVKPHDWLPIVKHYIGVVRGCYYKLQGAEMLVEQRIKLFGNKCWGSGDAIIVVPGVEAHVFDLKAGSGHIVSPSSDQFKCYAAGVALLHKWGLERVVTHRVQYAAEEQHATAEFTMDELKDHLKEVKKAIKLAEDLRTQPGPVGDHCRWCPAHAHCPAQRDQVLSVLEADDIDEKIVVPAPGELTPERLVKVLKAAPDIIAWLKACEKHALSAPPPGFKVVAGRANRKWNPDFSEDQIAETLALYGVDEPYEPPKLKSFTKIEKMIGKDNLGDLVIKPEGAPTLVPDDDPRNDLLTEVLDD